ncbi:MAG: pyruvate kinase [Planctomycetes bacterium]|nr:pyruvate kinase [Planctomycetota bacterium]
MRRTTIVATLGPASRSPEMIARLIAAGVDVFRLNFSHGDHASHAAVFSAVRAASVAAGRAVAILQDLQGPKIRIGTLAGGGPVELVAGRPFVITARELAGDAERVSTTYAALPHDVRVGDLLLLDDGLLRVRVTGKDAGEVRCEVVVGGPLGEHKGINLPGVPLSTPSLTPKDREDVAAGLAWGVDYVALSFVRRPEDVLELKELIRRAGQSVPVIAKIEKPEAIDRLEAIVDAADALMVARGDLGVEVSVEQVPVLQKRIIAAANRRAKPVITATQMLESMVANPLPTRAEATDVANAILDGTDAVMLSGETARGKYPVETVLQMARIAEATETALYPFERPLSTTVASADPDAEALVDAACYAGRELKPAAFAVFTQTGATACLLSQQRPAAPILAFTPDPATYRRMALYWGVTPRLVSGVSGLTGLVAEAERTALALGWARPGDRLTVIGGATGPAETSTLLKLHRIAAPAPVGAR